MDDQKNTLSGGRIASPNDIGARSLASMAATPSTSC